MYLEEKYRVPIEKIPDYIIQAKKTLDNLEDERQEILRQKQEAREDRDTIRQQLDEMRQQSDAVVIELEKYEKEIPSIMRIKELEMELDKVKKLNKNYETHIIRLERKLNNAGLEAMRLESDRSQMQILHAATVPTPRQSGRKREEKCSVETMPANTLYLDYLARNGIVPDNQIQKKPAVLDLKKLTPDTEGYFGLTYLGNKMRLNFHYLSASIL